MCSLQGVDYSKLREAAQSNGGSSSDPSGSDADIGKFADEYIGDYVERLKDFMDYYNVQYPFREADDRSVISLKEHLLSATKGCSAESKNLLFYSDALYTGPSTGGGSREGWEVHACDTASTNCLDVRRMPAPPPAGSPFGTGGAPATLPSILPPGGVGGITWLQTRAKGTTPGVTLGAPSGVASPVASVYQAVTLSGQKQYSLSWWDTSLTSAGAQATSGGTSYRAAIYDSSWHLVAVETPTSTAGAWSDRQSTDFMAPADGTYFVAFEVPGAAAGVNIGIANVQLQVAAPGDGFTGAYESTSDKRVVFSTDCGASPTAIQDAFVYRCENGTCFYDLRAPFTINTTLIEGRDSNLTGVIGAGNYNHRHLNIAVNVVGTGVLDCEKHPTPACYGTAFLEYDLSHDAYDVPMVDYGGQPRCFTFGTGAVRGGKALTAERYITSPLSSADEGLVNQAGILRPELAGRPLSGSYRIRIYDNAALNWQQIEDIQIVLGYRVWSRVSRVASN